MKKGQMCEGIIEYIDFPNKGRVKVEDQYVTVKNGIPGQKIRFVINKKRKDRCEGRLLEVLEKSPLETIEPVCHEFPACGFWKSWKSPLWKKGTLSAAYSLPAAAACIRP